MSMAFSSAAYTFCDPSTKYDVFLSFRGEDTRNNFTSHLYKELCRKKIETYKDDRLVRGEDISLSLMRTIEESKIYVIIFSKGYASSTWCLNELVKILECRDRYGRSVIPVFYEIDPSNVRKQSGSYEQAFLKHVLQFQDKTKVQRWKASLTKAASLAGWDSRTTRPEAHLIVEIVKDISEKLNRMPVSDFNEWIGIKKHIESMEALLNMKSADVRIVGIWGMGGIGKTTIAYAIFQKFRDQFESCSFVANVQDVVGRSGLDHIRDKYLKELLENENLHIDSSSPRSTSIKERLKRLRVLLVLDNVNNSRQLEDLLGGHNWFGLGSRIIVTTRDMQVLKSGGAFKIYEVKEMDFSDALQVFCMNAFKQNYPIKDYEELSIKVVNYAKGVPLALKILGSFLCYRRKVEWQSALEKLGKYPNMEIFNVLNLSYDGLDDEEKDIFLDIACFFKGQDVNFVKQTLEDFGFSADIGISVLVDRCLVYIVRDKILMHDLIEEMGREIVRRQSVHEPGKRSRVWKHEDAYHILRMNKGTEAVQCISLDMCQRKIIYLSGAMFEKMHNLRFLHFCKSKPNQNVEVYISGRLKDFPNGLRVLHWDGWPLRSWPLNVFPENLVKLDLRDSLLEKLWDGVQYLPNLKKIDLSGSKHLIGIPDLSQTPNIEELFLSYCTSLIEVSSSSLLNRLSCLWLDGCVQLNSVSLPTTSLLRSSGSVVLHSCLKLEKFSISHVPIERKRISLFGMALSLRRVVGGSWISLFGMVLLLSRVVSGRLMLEKFFDTSEPIDDAELQKCKDKIGVINLKLFKEGLCWLDLSYCKSLTSLPSDICTLKSLRKLSLRGCSKLEDFPEILEPMENLERLILDETGIRRLPLSLKHLIGLQELSLRMCRKLVFIPSLIGSLSKLSKLDLTYCESLETIPSSIFELKLARLNLCGCLALFEVPEIRKFTGSLSELSLTGTGIRKLPASLDRLIRLEQLHLNMCIHFQYVPQSICNMFHLTKLNFSGCNNLLEIPNSIGRLSSLKELSLCQSNILRLPLSIAHLPSLISLELSDCPRLESIPELPPFLMQFLAFDCPLVKRVSTSRFEVSEDLQENQFEFHLTNCPQLEQSACGNILAYAWFKFPKDIRKSVFFCFPGSEIPHWFPYRSMGLSVNTDSSEHWYNKKLFDFAVCVVVATEAKTLDECRFEYRFRFISEDVEQFLPNRGGRLLYYYGSWKGEGRSLDQDHIFLWNCRIGRSARLDKKGYLTLEIYKSVFHSFSADLKVKECGICPLYEE